MLKVKNFSKPQKIHRLHYSVVIPVVSVQVAAVPSHNQHCFHSDMNKNMFVTNGIQIPVRSSQHLLNVEGVGSEMVLANLLCLALEGEEFCQVFYILTVWI